MKKRLVFSLAALASAAALAGALLLSEAPAPEVGFLTLDGERLVPAQLRGQVVLVNFWATDCPPCLAKMPKLVALHRTYAPLGFETIAVARKDDPERVAAFAARERLPFRVALDGDGTMGRAFGDVRATPTTFLMDRKGRVLVRVLGEPDWPALHALIEKALAEPA